MPALLNAVICASMAASAECYTSNPEPGVKYPTREECEQMAEILNNEQFLLTEEKLDADGKPRKVWVYYCRAIIE